MHQSLPGKAGARLRVLRNAFDTHKAAFTWALIPFTAGPALWAFFQEVPPKFVLMLLVVPLGVWFLGYRQTQTLLAAKDAEVQSFREREQIKRGEVFAITAEVRLAAGDLPFHIAKGNGGSRSYAYYGALAPRPGRERPEYAALNGKCREAYLWVERWCTRGRASRLPHIQGTKRVEAMDVEESSREAGRFKDEIMAECDLLEGKAMRGELPLPHRPPMSLPPSS